MKKQFTIAEVAEALAGRYVGDGTIVVDRVTHPSDAECPQDLALATDKSLIPLLAAGKARAAIVGEGAEIADGILGAVIFVKRPRLALAGLTNLFADTPCLAAGIHPTAIVESGAQLGENVAIGAQAYIGAGAIIGANSVIHPQVYVGQNAIIGEGALIHAGVKIGDSVRIGKRFIIHFNSTVGADGFSFVTPQLGSVESAKATGAVGASNSELIRIASLGTVVIGDDVEVGANTSIDRGTIAATRIGNGTKIDNQVQVGHNVIIGENCLICGRVGIAGSVVIGNRVVLGGATGIADHVTVGDDAIAMGMSGVSRDVAAKSLVIGIPAKPRAQAIEQQFNINRIKSLVRKVQELTERMDAL